MSQVINGWGDFVYTTIALEAGIDNAPMAGQYLSLVPQMNDERVVGFGTDLIDASTNWLMEITNGDQTNSLSVCLIGGVVTPNVAPILLPVGYGMLRILPGCSQRIVYLVNTGWRPLIDGMLVAE